MAYLTGNLVGRFIMSVIIVWIVMFFIKRFDFKKSWASIKAPFPILCILINNKVFSEKVLDLAHRQYTHNDISRYSDRTAEQSIWQLSFHMI